MSLEVRPWRHGFGAEVTGFDAHGALPEHLIRELRDLWIDHLILSFPGQFLTPTQLSAFAARFGEFGEDPFVTHLTDHPHVLEVRREPDEHVAPFGSSWHSDWSFQPEPPSATFLQAHILPPHGGTTLFADGYRAFESLSSSLQSELLELNAIHSARRPYSPSGFLAGGGPLRSMSIVPSDKALDTQVHPLVRTHPESGRKALWVNPAYTIGVAGLPEPESERLLNWLVRHATQDEFTCAHTWQPGTLCMWDNRCTQHCAQGGYDGHRRVMHRVVIAGDMPV